MPMASNESKGQRPWFEAYPAPKTAKSDTVTKEELRQWILGGEKSGKDFIVVDVRREDHEVTDKAFVLVPYVDVF